MSLHDNKPAMQASCRAAHEAFAIAEILEAILDTNIISLAQLFLLQRVDRNFEGVIRSSTRLRKRMYLEHTHLDFSSETWHYGDPDNAIGRTAVNPLLLPDGFNHPLLDIAHRLYKSPILYPSSAPSAGPDEYHILLREQRMYRNALQQAVRRFLDMPTGFSWEATHLIDADVPVTLKWHAPCNNSHCGREPSVLCSKTRWSVKLPQGCTLGHVMILLRGRFLESDHWTSLVGTTWTFDRGGSRDFCKGQAT